MPSVVRLLVSLSIRFRNASNSGRIRSKVQELSSLGAAIPSAGGNVNVTSQGGGSGSGTDDVGVLVWETGQITSGGAGTVTVNGTGGSGSGAGNYG